MPPRPRVEMDSYIEENMPTPPDSKPKRGLSKLIAPEPPTYPRELSQLNPIPRRPMGYRHY